MATTIAAHHATDAAGPYEIGTVEMSLRDSTDRSIRMAIEELRGSHRSTSQEDAMYPVGRQRGHLEATLGKEMD